MATKTLVYTTQTRLSCVCSDNTDVVLCIGTEGLLAQECGVDRATLDGTVTKAYKDCGNCGAPSWRYVITYSSDALLDPATNIVQDDITGIFCKGCIATWVEEQIAIAIACQ